MVHSNGQINALKITLSFDNYYHISSFLSVPPMMPTMTAPAAGSPGQPDVGKASKKVGVEPSLSPYLPYLNFKSLACF